MAGCSVGFQGGGKLTLSVFQDASSVGIGGIVLAIALACFLRETGHKAHPIPFAAKVPS